MRETGFDFGGMSLVKVGQIALKYYGKYVIVYYV